MTDDDPRWLELAQSLGPDGWFALTAVQAGCLALARTTADERGRQRITALLLVGDPVDAMLLKKFPIGSINVTLNIAEMPTRDPGEAAPLVDAARAMLVDHVETQARKAAGGVAPEPRERLSRPDGTDPDGFYRRVAAAYREVAATTRTVAPVLAEEADVPVPTVHRWVMEARRRGFLPPARKGRAG